MHNPSSKRALTKQPPAGIFLPRCFRDGSFGVAPPGPLFGCGKKEWTGRLRFPDLILHQEKRFCDIFHVSKMHKPRAATEEEIHAFKVLILSTGKP